MPRFTSSNSSQATVTALPTRRGNGPARVYSDAAIGYLPSKPRVRKAFAAAADDPLLGLELAIASFNAARVSTLPLLTGHGKPVSSLPTIDRRSPARRASYRTPPR